MSEITMRFAGPGDAAALAAMIDAMDRYYRDAERTAGETRKTAEDWLRGGAASDTRFLLAFAGDAPVGFASFAVLRPGNDLRGLLFLKDLFVVQSRRGQGIGEALMQYLARYCLDNEIGRIDWSTEKPNSQRFYERLGAVVKEQKVFMRLGGDDLARLADG